MNIKIRPQLIAMIIGFAIIYLGLFAPFFSTLSDGAKGFLVGIGLAVLAGPVIFQKLARR